MDLATIAEIAWEFDDRDPNWSWCVEHASLAHREACEFILYIGSPMSDSPNAAPYLKLEVEHMRQGGCTEDFIDAYLAAKDAGALRVIFYC